MVASVQKVLGRPASFNRERMGGYNLSTAKTPVPAPAPPVVVDLKTERIGTLLMSAAEQIVANIGNGQDPIVASTALLRVIESLEGRDKNRLDALEDQVDVLTADLQKVRNLVALSKMNKK